MAHTKESLDELRLKSDVVAIAEEVGLDTDGTRAEITERILALAPDIATEENIDIPVTPEVGVAQVEGRRARRARLAISAEESSDKINAYVSKHARFDAGSYVVKFARVGLRGGQPYQLAEQIKDLITKGRAKVSDLG